MRTTEHAKRQAEARCIPIQDVIGAALDRLAERRMALESADVAIFVGVAESGGWQGASNGDRVWAIIRDGVLATVMYRRSDQPSTPEAFRTRTVIA